MNKKELITNHKVYVSKESRLRDVNKQWYAFPDLYDCSNTTDHMYKDHVYKISVWYQYKTSNLLKLIMVSVHITSYLLKFIMVSIHA